MYSEIIPTHLKHILSLNLRRILGNAGLNYNKLQEVRLRCNQPLILYYDNQEFYSSEEQGLHKRLEQAYIVTHRDIHETMEYVSNYSFYAFEEEMKQGFITVAGGHRVGITGKVLMENGKIKNIQYVAGINIRFAHEVIGCGQQVFPYLLKGKDCSDGIYNALIISAPGAGKTTLLRDVIRMLSSGAEGVTVGVVDERSEIAACYLGVPQNQVGIRTDVLDACPKAIGIPMLIRTMSPKVIAVDEIGGEKDVEAIRAGIYCGCAFIGTVHGTSFEELQRKPVYKKMLEQNLFQRYIVLSAKPQICKICSILDEKGEELLEC